MDILKKINQLRLDKNWSIYRLSVESGVPQSTITNMFNRETLPSIITLQSICNAFGITLSDFFKEEEISENLDYAEFEGIYEKLPNDVKKSIFKLMKNIVDNQWICIKNPFLERTGFLMFVGEADAELITSYFLNVTSKKP